MARSIAEGEDVVDVLGVPVAPIDISGVSLKVAEWLGSPNQSSYVCVTGVHGVMEAQANADVMKAHLDAGLVVPDGMPLVWSGRRAGFGNISRCYGPDLMLALHEVSAERGWTQYYYGGQDGVASELSEVLASQFGTTTAGVGTPPFRPLQDSEVEVVAHEIEQSGADLVWVGLSTPKQELLMRRLAKKTRGSVYFGVGAAFDFHTGRVRQAPTWMQRSGLEWLFRVSTEPRRLARRYATNNPRFIVSILRRPPVATTRSALV